jgi:hypothetical protein
VQQAQSNAPPGAPPLPMPPGIDGSAPLGDALLERIERIAPHLQDAEKLKTRIFILRKVMASSNRDDYRAFAFSELRAIELETKRLESQINTQVLGKWQHLLEQLAEQAPTTTAAQVAQTAPAATRAPRPRTARRQHTSTTRSTVAAASSASGESGSPPSGGTQGSASPASSADEPEPAGRIKHRHEWIVARVSVKPAGSPASFTGVSA